MKMRRVVTAFLAHDGKILLLKRSSKVRTYPGCWAGISGSIEQDDKSPDERVLKEIREETGLCPEDIQFVRKGKPVKIEDVNRLWMIYPFLYNVPNPDKIYTNWEHTEKQWIEPGAITAYHTVPNLAQTLDSVYLRRRLAKRVADIKADRAHGASELALMALHVLNVAMTDEPGKSPDALLAHLSNVAWHLCRTRPSMAALTNATTFVLYHARKALNQLNQVSNLRAHISEIIDVYETNCRNASQIISRETQCLLADNTTILTHSYSGTVVNAIVGSGRKNLHIIVTESRPLYEGVKTANRLSEKYGVTLITDAQAGHFIGQADIVLIGADTVLSDGTVVNKVGTHLIALAAERQNVPVYALCQTDKFLPLTHDNESTIELEEYDGSEVLTEGIQKVNVRNIYFDITPAPLIRGIVTELGILTTNDVLPIAKEMAEYESVWHM